MTQEPPKCIERVEEQIELPDSSGSEPTNITNSNTTNSTAGMY